MTYRPLLLSPEVLERLQIIKQYAEENPYTHNDLLAVKAGVKVPPGDDPRFVALLPFDYRVVFSVEVQETGSYRHISLSIPTKYKFPSVFVLNELLGIMGFRNKVQFNNPLKEITNAFRMWIEHERAINVIELIL